MEAAHEPERADAATFDLQVHTHTEGVENPLSFSELPLTMTLGELKTKIKEKAAPASADETHQRLIYRGRYLHRDTETMKDVFGEESLKAHPIQSLHLAIRPKDDDNTLPQTPAVPNFSPIPPPPPQRQPPPARIPIQRNSSVPQYALPSALPYLNQNTNRLNQPVPQSTQQRPQVLSRETSEPKPMVYILSSPEGPRGILITDTATYHTPQSRTVPASEALNSTYVSDPFTTAYHPVPPPNDDIEAVVSNIAPALPDALTPSMALEYAADGFKHQMRCIYEFQLAKVRLSSAEVLVANTRRPWLQREGAMARFMEARREMLEAHSRAKRVSDAYEQLNARLPFHVEGHDEVKLKLAHRLGVNHLDAQETLFNLHSYPQQLEQFKIVAQRIFQQYLEAVVQVTPILSNMSNTAHDNYSATSMLQNLQRIRQPDAAQPTRTVREDQIRAAGRRRRRQDAAAPIPELGHAHGLNHRPMMAGLLAQVFPHFWLLFKLAIFVYAFTRVDDSWVQIATIGVIAFVILLYNLGALENFGGRMMAHIHGLLPPHQINEGQENANAGEQGRQAAGRDRAATITPEIYAAQLQRRQQENRSWLTNTIRAVEHAVLLFITSIVPGVGEQHIAARNAEVRARRRAQEEAQREAERLANEATTGSTETAAATVATQEGPSDANSGAASGNDASEGSSQPVRRNAASSENAGGQENPEPTRTEPMQAYIEDEMGVE